MENFEEKALEKLVLAPYVQKSTALRGKYRYVGGNQFRHAFSTFAILLDYHYIDPVLLKAAMIHDVFEDVKWVTKEEIMSLDEDGPQVYDLVIEVSRKNNESKPEFLKRILMEGTTTAKILKCADRISNIIDLHSDTFDKEFIKRYIEETKEYVIPMAAEVNSHMLFELKDLIKKREKSMSFSTHFWPLQRKED